MQLFDDIDLALAFGDFEPRIKVVCRVENLREKEVQQGPQLMQVVLSTDNGE